MTSESDLRPAGAGERVFRIEELFFSRTDPHGVIQAGNSVFQRVSGYDWSEMMGRPHKLIRHPDMPRAVFWLLWDTIKRGEPIGAYVKNRAKDGGHYWVYAIVTPIDGGYLSVRLKPGSALFDAVRDEYRALAAAETSEQIAPADSARLLLGRLAELGFEDYPAFMAATVSQELRARDRNLGRSSDLTMEFFEDLVGAARTLLARASAISEAYSRNAFVPLNLRIQAAQLGNEGASIGEISNNYEAVSTEIKRSMARFVESARQVTSAVNAGLFLVCVARVQQEMVAFFRNEEPTSGVSAEQEMRLLEAQRSTYGEKATEGLRVIARQAEEFRKDCSEMRRLASGMEVTRIMGKVECARLGVTKDGLNELLDDLETFQKAIAGGLGDIDRMNERIRHHAEKLLGARTAV